MVFIHRDGTRIQKRSGRQNNALSEAKLLPKAKIEEEAARQHELYAGLWQAKLGGQP